MVKKKGTFKKGVSILGSTGSIGRQTLEVVSAFMAKFHVVGLAAKTNLALLEEQTKKFKPQYVSVETEEAAEKLIRKLGKTTTTVYFGEEGLKKTALNEETDIVVSAIPGTAGLVATLKAVKAGKTICLASKEVLVAAGGLVMEEARTRGVKILPIDSEHSAIAQIIRGEETKKIKKIILTASGGPLLNAPKAELAKVSPEEALSHPTWTMGQKISIDSATLMNKGFEVIEAHHLFGIDYSQIEVIIHPQSIIHSMVEFVDGSVMAQMGAPDMRLPIQYALFSSDRVTNIWPRLDFSKLGSLTFLKADRTRFPCLDLAYQAGRHGGTYPAVLGAADEAAVELFLKGKISYTDIPALIKKTMEKHASVRSPKLEDIIEADRWAREEILSHNAFGAS